MVREEITDGAGLAVAPEVGEDAAWDVGAGDPVAGAAGALVLGGVVGPPPPDEHAASAGRSSRHPASTPTSLVVRFILITTRTTVETPMRGPQ